MLAACHDRIEDRCELLERLVLHIQSQGCDDQARQAASNLLRYFDSAGVHHHQDEEQDLFPRLLGSGDARALPLVEQLRREHEEMRGAWTALRAPLQKIASGEPAELEMQAARHFSKLYEAHIALEDGELLPLAAELLDEPALSAIGGAMAARRGVAS